MASTVAAQAGVGTAHLSAELSDDGPYTIHGVAIGEDDITYGKSETKKLWKAEALRDVAETLEGQPLVKHHQNNAEGTIGTVTKATYRNGVGVLYEAEIAPHYEEMAKDVASGILDVSPRILHTPPAELETDESTGALVVDERAYGDNLSIVSDGASPSNTAEIGEAEAMAQSAAGVVASLERNGESIAVEELRNDLAAEPDAPDWEEGDFVRWQVEPDLFGKIVHVDDEKHVAMVEVMGMDDGDLVSTGFTITAGFSDIRQMKMPESNANLAKHGDDEEEMSAAFAAEELAEIGDMDINGIVMWDDKMGAISGFEMDDGELMVELDVVEREGGSFQTTGETVMKSMTSVDSMERADDGRLTPTELQSMSTHTPEFDGTVDQEWSEPSMSEFMSAMDVDADSWDDLTEEQRSAVADHFLVSKGGFPPETFGDLALPVVETDGQLNLNALTNAKARAGQVSGLSGDTLGDVESMIDSLANDNFEDASFGESEDDEMESTDNKALAVASLEGYDGHHVTTGQSDSGQKNAATFTHDSTMTDITYEELSDADLDDGYVAVREEQLESVVEQAEEAEELNQRLDDVNTTLETLADKQETLDQVDDDHVEELASLDDPVVRSQDEWDELTDLVDNVGELFAEELADYSPFTAEELTDKFSPMDLKEKVEDHEDASIEAELESGDDVDPKGGHAGEEELGSGGDDAEEYTLEEKREAVAEELESSGLDRQAEKVRAGKIKLDDLGVTFE